MLYFFSEVLLGSGVCQRATAEQALSEQRGPHRHIMSMVVPNSQIPAIREIVCIVGALCNAFRPPLSVGNEANN